MNPKVQEFLDKKEKEKLKRRNEHLIELGLVDKSKIEKKYGSAFRNNAIQEEETGRYYVERYGALEVTDEEYAEICKYSPERTLYKETKQINKEMPRKGENNVTILQIKEDISSIKSWVKFWSILSIVCGAIAFILLIANQ